MSGNFKPGTFILDKLTKKIYELQGYDTESLEKGQTNALLIDPKGTQWICYFEELPLRFKVFENQKAAKILYSNNMRGTK